MTSQNAVDESLDPAASIDEKGGESHRSGNRRSQRAHDATIEATISLLLEIGYHALTIEGIAARAGVGKATIYRWWPSKAALVLHVMIDSLPEIASPPNASDSVLDDLYHRMDFTNRRMLGVFDGVANMALVADLRHSSPDLLERYRTEFVGPQRASMRIDLQRAIAAGLLPPDADLDLIMDIWAGTVAFRSFRNDSSVASAGQVGRELIDCVLAAPPRLPSSSSARRLHD